MSGTHEKRRSIDELGDQLERDLTFNTVKPIDSKWVLAGKTVAVATLVLSTGVLLNLSFRSDAAVVGPWLLWGLLAVEVLLTFTLFAVLFSEVVPSRKLKPSSWLAVPPIIFAVQLLVAYATYLRSPMNPAPERITAAGLKCMGIMALMGLVPLCLAFWLLSRGLPLRPRLTGLLVGLTGGLLADSIYRLHCPYSGLDHVLSWHSVSVLLLGLLGFGAGIAWDVLVLRRWRARRSKDAK